LRLGRVGIAAALLVIGGIFSEIAYLQLRSVPANNEGHKLVPSQANALVGFHLSPANALVKVDGNLVTKGAEFKQELPPGTHEVEVFADQYETHREMITVSAGDQKEIAVTLPRIDPQSVTGVIDIHVMPKDAQVSIDGRPLETANNFHRGVSAGDHEVEISALGYETRRETISVTAGVEKSLELTLSKLPELPPSTGTLEIDIYPTKVTADVAVDGKSLGVGHEFRGELLAGKHDIQVTSPEYEPLTRSITITAGQTTQVPLQMVAVPRAPAPPTTGILELRIIPEFAEIEVDGNQMGVANGFKRELAAGAHQVEIYAEGYETRREVITVMPGGEKNVELALTKVGPPVPSKGTLDVELYPASAKATILVDGKQLGTGDELHYELEPGMHNLQIVSPDYDPLARSITIIAGQATHIPLRLTARAPTKRSPVLNAKKYPTPPAAQGESPYVPPTARTIPAMPTPQTYQYAPAAIVPPRPGPPPAAPEAAPGRKILMPPP
jgi:hypothetical protein